MTMEYTTRPLSDRTWLRADNQRTRSQFSASWTSTLEILRLELGRLNARGVVIGMDITETDIRLDGLPRATATPATPAVEVAFGSKYGPLIYRCDAFTAGARYRADSWQHNVRAIALTLRALRSVDRYEASARGEQYRGYRALGAGTGTDRMDQRRALEVIDEMAGGEAVRRGEQWSSVIRAAKVRAHPDRNGGSRERWDLLMEAIDVVGVSV